MSDYQSDSEEVSIGELEATDKLHHARNDVAYLSPCVFKCLRCQEILEVSQRHFSWGGLVWSDEVATRNGDAESDWAVRLYFSGPIVVGLHQTNSIHVLMFKL